MIYEDVNKTVKESVVNEERVKAERIRVELEKSYQAKIAKIEN